MYFLNKYDILIFNVSHMDFCICFHNIVSSAGKTITGGIAR
nr:MAG TPA: hypothetical protein [Inoviridae sp.]